MAKSLWALVVAALQVAAAPLSAEVQLALPQVQAVPGEKTSVPLSLFGEAVPGIISLRIRILYEDAWLKFSELRQGALLRTGGFLAQANAVPGGEGESLLAISLAGTQPLEGEGKLLDLVFEVAPIAPGGAEAELRFAPDTRANRGQPLLVVQSGAVEVQVSAELLSRPGDFDGDQAVDFDDFFVLGDRFGERRGGVWFTAVCDLDQNGQVNLEDFFLFAELFGRRY
ncbi:MAG: hypothetical protein HYW07_08780 [Candidatus Latescibacteria bacterium]|nr:hypothetical protein [Candidatus Latescibacterota bacterium]